MYKVITYWEEDQTKMFGTKSTSRYLWTDHIVWTRCAMLSIMGGELDVDDLTTRLLKNQDDIGGMLTDYYYDADVAKIVSLLKDHIAGAAAIFASPASYSDLEITWRSNGTDLVNHLNSMNPTHWTIERLQPLWTTHLDYTLAQMNARTAKDWATDIDSFDTNHTHIIEWADVFANGIINHNIEKFSKPLKLIS